MTKDFISKESTPFARPHIPESVTSGGMASEDTPTPSPKRRKIEQAKLAQGQDLLENLNADLGTIGQKGVHFLQGIPPQEEVRPLATAKGHEMDAEDESGSDVYEVGLAEFDTEGITMEELKLWSRCAPMDQKLVLNIDSPVRKVAPKVHFSNRADRTSKGKAASMHRFIREHQFFLLRQTSSFTTSQRKAFEMDVFQQARKVGFSSANAEKQIILARRLCGEKKYDGGLSKLDNEVSDSETVTRRDSTDPRDDCCRGSSSATLRSVKPFQDAEESAKPSNQSAESLLEDEAAETVGTIQRKKKKRRRSTSSAGNGSKFTEVEEHANSEPTNSDNQQLPSQSKIQKSKSDGVNGDPSQLLEVPDDVSWYLEAQAKRKKAKDTLSSSPTLGIDTRGVQNDHGLGNKSHRIEVLQVSGPTDMNEKFNNDERLEKKLDSKRHRHGKRSRSSSTTDRVVEPTDPGQELTIDQRAERKSRKNERRQRKRERRLQRRREAESNRDSGASSTDREPQASVDNKRATNVRNENFAETLDLLNGEPAEDRFDRKPLHEIKDEARHRSQKHKKKHKSKERSVSKESGFQSPMIHNAKAAEGGSMIQPEERTIPSTPNSKHSAIDLLFPFSDSPLSTPPSSPILPPSPSSPTPKKRKLLPPKTSPYFPTPPRTPRPKRPPTSCVPFPPLSAPRFGLIQESLANTPFALLLATIFLNKTRGRVALPLFYQLLEKWPTPETLATAAHEDVVAIFSTLGLQNQRARKVVQLAKAWVDNPPAKGKRWRRLGYPCPSDGRDIKSSEGAIADEEDDKRIAWEVGNLPGVGRYAIDSWRIFCRDQLRRLPFGMPALEGLVDPDEGNEAEKNEEDTQKATAIQEELSKEWTRVLPLDKELRAYLRWRWLRLGWEWDPVTGERVRASEEVMKGAEKGGVVIEEEGVGGRIEGVGNMLQA